MWPMKGIWGAAMGLLASTIVSLVLCLLAVLVVQNVLPYPSIMNFSSDSIQLAITKKSSGTALVGDLRGNVEEIQTDILDIQDSLLSRAILRVIKDDSNGVELVIDLKRKYLLVSPFNTPHGIVILRLSEDVSGVHGDVKNFQKEYSILCRACRGKKDETKNDIESFFEFLSVYLAESPNIRFSITKRLVWTSYLDKGMCFDIDVPKLLGLPEYSEYDDGDEIFVVFVTKGTITFLKKVMKKRVKSERLGRITIPPLKSTLNKLRASSEQLSLYQDLSEFKYNRYVEGERVKDVKEMFQDFAESQEYHTIFIGAICNHAKENKSK